MTEKCSNDRKWTQRSKTENMNENNSTQFLVYIQNSLKVIKYIINYGTLANNGTKFAYKGNLKSVEVIDNASLFIK